MKLNYVEEISSQLFLYKKIKLFSLRRSIYFCYLKIKKYGSTQSNHKITIFELNEAITNNLI